MSLVTQTLPLFPLDVVLFPGMVLPLHIFEPRYRKMVRDCVVNRQPFGLVWTEDEPLELDPDRPLIGTAAVITEVEPLPDGRFNINIVGSERFQVRSLSYDEPYLVGHVSPYPVQGSESTEADRLRPQLMHSFTNYLALLNQIAENEIALDEEPDSATMLAFVVAVYYQSQNWRKQQLLDIPSLPDLMRFEIDLLRVENPLIEQTLQMRDEDRLPPLIANSLAVYGLN